MLIKTLICDDSEKARYILKEYLKIIPVQGIEVIGEAQNGYDLIDLCKKNCPDLILLDIDMPFINGIETAKEIIKFLPDVFLIFITAFPSFSVEAFEVHPADFILKPVSIERLEKTLNYIVQIASKKTNSNDSEYLTVSIAHELHPIKQNDILFIERIQRKTIIHTPHKIFEVFEPLGSLQEKLNPKVFHRVHNSYIANINSVAKIVKHPNGSNELKFGGYKQAAFASRRNVNKLEKMLKSVIK